MKICWWTNYRTTYQTAILAALRAAGANVVVCYFKRYDAYRKTMGWVERPLEAGEYFAQSVKSARQQIPDFDTRVQMVPSFFNLTSWRVMAWCVTHRRPWFAVTEGSRGRLATLPLRLLFAMVADRWALKVFCIGERALRQFSRLGVRQEKLARFRYATRAPEMPKRVQRPDGVTFVYSGALTKRKAVDILAAAFRSVVARHPSACLHIVGDGPLRGIFDGIPNVEQAGAVAPEAATAAMASGDVIVLPSRYDPWGVALVEGAVLGMAMIASDRVGAAELIRPDENGYVVPAGDKKTLAEVMERYAANPQLAKAHGQAARAAAAQADPDRLAREILEGLSDDFEGAFDTLTATGEGLLPKGVEGPPVRTEGDVVCDFWEEHCTECGEPECYKTCPLFSRAANGRCRRFAEGIRFARDGQGRVAYEISFLRWGKLELMFHGKLATGWTARAVVAWHQRYARVARALECLLSARFLPHGRSPCGLFRSLRWREALRSAEYSGMPTTWVLDCLAERRTALVCEMRDVRDRVAFSEIVNLPAAPARSVFSFPLPDVPAGSLFRIYPADGEETGKVWFFRNALVREAASAPFVKCVAWDLDGVVWHGTLSEDGVDALRLNVTTVETIKTLDARGIVNSVCSRNDSDEALAALRKFGLEEYFVFPQIGWGAKSTALRVLADELNIGRDALAFVDDRSENRGEVEARLPMVRVFSEMDVDKLAGLPCFNPPVSNESVGRRMRYRDEMNRRGAARAFGGDYEAFLESCRIELSYFDLASAEKYEVERCVELVRRSNRLTLTGNRYTESEFRALISAPETYGWGVRCRDRYGDYGIVGVVVATRENDACRIREFVMSCRVANKGCEKRVLEWVLGQSGCRRLVVRLVETGRNHALRKAIEPFLEK